MDEAVARFEIDGVKCIWVNDDSRNLSAGVSFRVGISDEPFNCRGFTHLIEHLALRNMKVDHGYNGYVDTVTTNFVAEGSTEEIKTFIEQAVNGLANLPFGRLDVERKVLLAEAERNGVPAAATALAVMFGSRGYGSVGLPESGLWRASPELLEQWRRRWFTKENMVVWFAGPEPAQPTFDAVPSGGAHHLPAPSPRWLKEARSYIWNSVPGPFALNVQPRSTALNTAMALASVRLSERLRSTEGVSYSVGGRYEPFSADDALVVLSADCLAEDSTDVFAMMTSELNRMSMSGPTEDELAEHIRLRRRATEERNAVAQAAVTARNDLLGTTTPSQHEIMAEVEATPPGEYGRVISEMLASALWVLPGTTQVRDHRFINVDHNSTGTLTGPSFPSKYRDVQLGTSPGRLGLVDPESGRELAVEIDKLVGVTAYSDGAKTFHRPDAVAITLQHEDFKGAADIYHSSVNAIPEDLIVSVPKPFRNEEDLAELERLRAERSKARSRFEGAKKLFQRNK